MGIVRWLTVWRRLLLHTFQFRQYSAQHSDKAEASSDDVGYWFSQEYTSGSHVQCIWHQIGERHYNEDFTKQGEEDRLLLFIQRLENGLSNILQIHENKGCKILIQCRNGVLNQRSI